MEFTLKISCITDSQNSTKISTGYSHAGEKSQGSIGTSFRDGVDRTSNVPGKRKLVRFDCDLDQSYSSISSKNSTSKIPEKAGESNLSATSHSLTSLQISNEIQTHGTIFPENTESTTMEKTESPLSVTCEGKLDESSASITPWVKQSEEKSNQNLTAVSTVTYGDRPIIGAAAAHWNEKEQSQISPKWWDGNGIPNSTNKYKEVPTLLY